MREVEPLAERLRPRSLDEVLGQPHLTGPKGLLRRMLEAGRLSSMVLFGPPGTGKTTLARILAGIVAAVRFRVSLDDSRDATFVFAVMALGLACGVQLETAAVLSVLFVTLTLVLSYSDFARTPPGLEGERAAKHFERAVQIAE